MMGLCLSLFLGGLSHSFSLHKSIQEERNPCPVLAGLGRHLALLRPWRRLLVPRQLNNSHLLKTSEGRAQYEKGVCLAALQAYLPQTNLPLLKKNQ